MIAGFVIYNNYRMSSCTRSSKRPFPRWLYSISNNQTLGVSSFRFNKGGSRVPSSKVESNFYTFHLDRRQPGA